MYKVLKAIGIFVIVVLIGGIVFGTIMYLAHRSKWNPIYPLGYLDGIDSSMRPTMVTKVLGEPEEQSHLLSNDSVCYSYEIKMDGAPTELSLFFIEDKYLYIAVANIDAGTPENAISLAERWKDKIIHVYEKIDGYYCEETRKTSGAGYETNLGISSGAVGVGVEITVHDTIIQIRTDFSS